MDEEGRKLVVIDWHEGMTVLVPEDYEPRYIEVGPGEVIDETRWLYINQAILDVHPDSDRLWQVAKEHPGLTMDKGPEGKIVVMLYGEPIGLVDSRVLDAQLTPNVVGG